KACLIIPTAHNPLGFTMPERSKRRLVEMVTRFNVPLIEDDIYGDLSFETTRPAPCKTYDTQGLVLLCSSFSKTLAPGARVGWCTPGRYIQEVTRQKLLTTLATPTLPQRAIAEYLATGRYEKHMRRVRRAYADQLNRFATAVQRYFPPGTCVTRPSGGFVLWVQMPDEFDSIRLYEAARERKIAIAPGPIFSPRGKYRNCLRLNVSQLLPEQVDRTIQVLGELTQHSRAEG